MYLYGTYQIRPFVIAPDPELLISYLVREFPVGEYLCAYEARFRGYGLYEALCEAQIHCIIVHAADIPTSHKESEFILTQKCYEIFITL
ncbi:MAG: transposase [Saprospiraceae bacterium]|jgi:transposase